MERFSLWSILPDSTIVSNIAITDKMQLILLIAMETGVWRFGSNRGFLLKAHSASLRDGDASRLLHNESDVKYRKSSSDIGWWNVESMSGKRWIILMFQK